MSPVVPSRLPLPRVPGVLGPDDVDRTGSAIAELQLADGAIPWAEGQPVDVWNHVEAAMALLVTRRADRAEAAYEWCARTQRYDGSWPQLTTDGVVTDPNTETNMAGYLAVGIWHHWLMRRDRRFVDRLWPTVRAGLDLVVDLQLPFGGIAWARGWSGSTPGPPAEEALLAGSSSLYHALRAGVALADLLDDPQPEWELAGGRLGHAIRRHQDSFADKDRFSMDWYYPVLGGALRGAPAAARLAGRWEDFVVPGLGVRCVAPNPWVTGAETCELVLALEAMGDPRAATLFAQMQHLRRDDGGYWTGYVYADQAIWPAEHTSYTSAAVVLAADALSRATPGSGIIRGDGLAPQLRELALECGCEPTRVPA